MTDELERLRAENANLTAECKRYQQLAADADAGKGGLTVRVEWNGLNVFLTGTTPEREDQFAKELGEWLKQLTDSLYVTENVILRGRIAAARKALAGKRKKT